MFIGLFIYSFNLQLCWLFVAVHGLSLVVGSGGYSWLCCGLLIAAASLVAGHRLCSAGLVALKHVEYSRTTDWTYVPCIDRQILNHGPPGKFYCLVFYLIIIWQTFELFQIFPITNTTIVIYVKSPLFRHFIFFLLRFLKVELLDHMVSLCLYFKETAKEF